MIIANASDLPRLMVCKGSRLLTGEVPPSSRDVTARDEGIAAHYMAQQVFNGATTLEELVDRKAPNGVYMPHDMAEHVEAYLGALHFPEPSFHSQMEIDTSHDFSPLWAISGRADRIDYTKSCDVWITDFKYGYRIVEPENNWTMISHAIGYRKQNRDRLHPNGMVNLSIFQPRPYHPDGKFRTWPISWATIDRLENELNAAFASMGQDDTLVTSNHCNRCQALVPCKAARLANMNAIDMTSELFADTIDNSELSMTLDNLNRAQDMIKSRLQAFEELAQHRLKGGQVIDNYGIEMGLGNTRWKEGVDGAMLKIITGKDLTVEKLATPAEAGRRGVNEITLKAITERPSTGVKLVRVKANKRAERLLGKK